MNNAGRLALCLLGILVIGAALWYFLTPAGTPTPPPAPPAPLPQDEEFTDAALELSFRYPPLYTLERHDLSTTTRKHIALVLTRTEDLPPPQNGEGPPTINVDAYQNDLDKYTLDRFIRGTSFTNFKLSPDGTIASTTVDGVPAASFDWSGLYEGRSVVVARDKWVYVFSATSLTPQDAILTDFEDVLDTVVFIAD